jgi:hypothetical protein
MATLVTAAVPNPFLPNRSFGLSNMLLSSFMRFDVVLSGDLVLTTGPLCF